MNERSFNTIYEKAEENAVLMDVQMTVPRTCGRQKYRSNTLNGMNVFWIWYLNNFSTTIWSHDHIVEIPILWRIQKDSAIRRANSRVSEKIYGWRDLELRRSLFNKTNVKSEIDLWHVRCKEEKFDGVRTAVTTLKIIATNNCNMFFSQHCCIAAKYKYKYINECMK